VQVFQKAFQKKKPVAPQLVEDRIVIGNGGPKCGCAGACGQRSGEMKWRLYAVYTASCRLAAQAPRFHPPPAPDRISGSRMPGHPGCQQRIE
jgi:hypothetical protein